MPYTLIRHSDTSATLHLTPYNALNPRGFVMVIGMTAASLSLPLIGVLGSPALWGLLPFVGIALWGLWFGLDRNWRDRQIVETMELSRTGITLIRQNPRAQDQSWQADPHWVTLSLSPRGGPVEHYLTMTGGGREIELGAFLMPQERITLHEELSELLIRLKTYA